MPSPQLKYPYTVATVSCGQCNQEQVVQILGSQRILVTGTSIGEVLELRSGVRGDTSGRYHWRPIFFPHRPAYARSHLINTSGG